MWFEDRVREFKDASLQSIENGANVFTAFFNEAKDVAPRRCPRQTFRMIEGITAADGLTKAQEESIELAREAIPELHP